MGADWAESIMACASRNPAAASALTSVLIFAADAFLKHKIMRQRAADAAPDLALCGLSFFSQAYFVALGTGTQPGSSAQFGLIIFAVVLLCWIFSMILCKNGPRWLAVATGAGACFVSLYFSLGGKGVIT